MLEQSGQAKSLTGQVLVRDLATALDGHGGISSITLNDDYTLTFTMADETTVTTTSVRGATGAKGDKGTDGRAITSVTKTGTSGLVDTYKIQFSDNTSTTFTVTNGSSIKSIAKTGTSGLVDTYKVTLTDNTTSTFTVTNGNGIASITLQSGTHAAGTTDVYKITFDNGQHTTFSVYNGLNGSGSVVSVNGESPDASGNVTVTGESIPLNDASETTISAALEAVSESVKGKQPLTNTLDNNPNVQDSDEFPFYDTSMTAPRKATWAALIMRIREKLFGTSSGFLKADGSGNVASAMVNMSDLADHAVSVVKYFQLPTTGWVKNSNDVYEADVTVSGLKTTDTMILGLRRGTAGSSGWTLTLAAFDTDRETFSKILAGRITAADTLHLYASEAITNATYLNCWVVSK